VLNANDTTWNQLKVWVDAAGNGDFQSNQLYSLDQLGITSINLNAEQVNEENNGNVILDDSTFTYSNGTTGDIAGVDLIYNPSPVQGDENNRLNSLIAAMASFNPQTADQTQSSLVMQATLEQLMAVNGH
jgi:trimeric autotransporter adhesin